MCPFVTLSYIDNRNGQMSLTVPTNNQTRFRFPSQLASQPRIFNSVEQLVKAWPLVVVARSDHHDKDRPAFLAVRIHERISYHIDVTGRRRLYGRSKTAKIVL